MIFLFVLLGLFSGLLGGLLGIGGGVITVPILYFIFHYAGMVEESMHMAVGTSLATGFVTSVVSTLMQLKKRAVQFSVVKLLMPGLIIGCILGAIMARYLSSEILSWVFGTMAILLGTYFFFPQLPHLYISSSPNYTLPFFGLLIGGLSSLLGIGGGSLAFPVLLGYQVPVRNCSATSSASTLITTFIGAMTYLVIASKYIEIPAFIGISVGAIISSPIGVKLSHVLDVALIKRILGCSLIAVGVSMFVL